MNIFIIILHFGSIDTTKTCVASLITHEKKFKKIIIVNNDEKVELNNQSFKKVSRLAIINNKKNIGFAAGVNVGIRYALKNHATHVLLLNNDTVIQESFITPLLTILESRQYTGLVGPVIYYKKNMSTLYDFGGYYNRLTGRTHHDERKSVENLLPKPVEYISGCCVLIKKEVFEAVGSFDEKFFLYYEDVDFAIRAQQKHFLAYVVPDVKIYHELSKAKGRLSTFSVYYQTKSGVIFGHKYARIKFLNVLFLLLQSIRILGKDYTAGISALKGLRDGLRSVHTAFPL